MRSILIVGLLLVFADGGTGTIDIGSVDRPAPPSVEELRAPKSDEGLTTVGLRSVITGKLPKVGQKVVVLVNPASNPDTVNRWWVQQKAEYGTDGNSFEVIVQAGEDAAGVGELFALVAIVPKNALDVGQEIDGLPEAVAYSKVVFVKRVK